jgi:hypothetical protein
MLYFSGESQHMVSEPVAGGRLIVARYHCWNHDHAIEWVMAGGKGEEARRSGAMVIQRVVHEVGGRTAFPVLTKINYSDWARLMRVKLKARGL